MNRALKKSINSSTLILSVMAFFISLIVIFASIHFEKSNFYKNFSRFVAVDFAEMERVSPQGGEGLIAKAIDKYNLLSGDRFTIHVSEIFNHVESENFVYASLGNKKVRFELKPLNSYFTKRAFILGSILLILSSCIVLFIRFIIQRKVIYKVYEYNRQIDKILQLSYSDRLTQKELIDQAQLLHKKVNYNQVKVICCLLRRLLVLPRSSSRQTIVRKDSC